MLNSFIQTIQREHLPDVAYFTKNQSKRRRKEKYSVEGAYLKPLEEMMHEFDYKPINTSEVKEHELTIYEPTKLMGELVIYLPGFGRNFTLFHLNKQFEQNNKSLIGVDLYNYGYSYYYHQPPRYNDYCQEKFDANLDYIISKYGKTITLMGNSTGATILIHYLNKRPDLRDIKVVLTSPAIPANGMPDIPFFGEFLAVADAYIPSLILAKDANPAEFPYINEMLTETEFKDMKTIEDWRKMKNWLHMVLQQYNRTSTDTPAYYDPLYSPLRNKSVTVGHLYHVTKVTDITFKNPTRIFCAAKEYNDGNIDIAAFKRRKFPSNVAVEFLDGGLHEILMSDKSTVDEMIRCI